MLAIASLQNPPSSHMHKVKNANQIDRGANLLFTTPPQKLRDHKRFFLKKTRGAFEYPASQLKIFFARALPMGHGVK